MRNRHTPPTPKPGRPLVVGLTGGMAAGKSTVARMLEALGAAVWRADDVAKRLYASDAELRDHVLAAFGEAVAVRNAAGVPVDIDRAKLSARVFGDPKALETLERLVHPAVAASFQGWLAAVAPDIPFVVREAAILFESGADGDCDVVVTVEAPEELRVQRALARGTTEILTRQDVLARMARQWGREARVGKADVVIENDGRPLLPQVLQALDLIQSRHTP